MIEPLRSQYLAALGIENYAPRFILPGAKLSEPCAWLEAWDNPSTANALSDESVIADKARDAKNSAEKFVGEKSANEIIQRVPGVDAVAVRPPRANDSAQRDSTQNTQTGSAKTPNVQIEAGPQFALSIVLAGGGILLIDNAPVSSAERNGFQQLLNNMLPALRPAAAQYILDVFLWPLTRQPKIPRDADAAKETLSAYLQKQINQRSINTVLLLGDVAPQWCAFDDSVRVIKSSSLLACVKDPALKRPLWNDIRHIAER